MSLALTGSNRRTMRRISAGSDAFEGVRRAEVEFVALVGSDLLLRAGGGPPLLVVVLDPDAVALAATNATAAAQASKSGINLVGARAAVAASNATGSRSFSMCNTLTYVWSAARL